MSSVNKPSLSGMRTPRSARSDSTIQSIEEDFDIEDDELSGANDLLKSDISQVCMFEKTLLPVTIASTGELSCVESYRTGVLL